MISFLNDEMEEVRRISKNYSVPWNKLPQNFAMIVVNTYVGTTKELTESSATNALLCKKKFEELGYFTNIMLDPTIYDFSGQLIQATINVKGKVVIYFYGHSKNNQMFLADGTISGAEISKLYKGRRSCSNLTFIVDCCNAEAVVEGIEADAIVIGSSATEESHQINQDKKCYGLMTYYFWKYYDQDGYETFIRIMMKKYKQTFKIISKNEFTLKI